ncbi:MAG: glycosyltransferase [bacterium]|nr:glycosyltransferase [bacterium]
MKLLMVSGDRSILEGKRGAFWYTLEEMAKHWDRIDVICPKPTVVGSELWVPSSENKPADNVHFHPSSKGLWYQILHVRNTGLRLVKEYKHDVMTVHEYPPFFNGLGGAMISTKTKIPFALEVHHLVGFPTASGWKEWIGRWMTPRVLPGNCRSASHVRTVNSAVRDQLIAWGSDPDHIAVVPSFYLDAQTLTPDPSIAKTYDVAFCARLVANKGLRNVLKAMVKLDGKTLLVIGDGPERKKSEALAKKLGIESRVHFVGWQKENADVYKALQTAKVFVMNSLSEGGPRSALEAMALGIPVVSTPVGVMPDVIEDNLRGVISTGQPGDLVDVIGELLENDARREELSRQGRTILNYFERSKLIKMYADFLMSLV